MAHLQLQVGEHECKLLAVRAQVGHHLLGLGPAARAQDAVASVEVALDGSQDGGLVVDRKQGRSPRRRLAHPAGH